MNQPSVSQLRNAAVSSGLVTQAQLDSALSSLALLEDGSYRSIRDIDDQELAQRLTELGFVNRWQAEQLSLGRTKFKLGPYRIVDAIGKGGMGHVFKGEHKLLGRVEAIKVLPKSKSTPEAIASFQREIRVQAQLDHPNLVRISYADRDGDTFFLVTEYVAGIDLRRMIRKHGPLQVPAAASVICEAAKALEYAHRKGLVHRDIKPGNILVTPEGQVKVIDLGLAWYLMENVSSTSSGNKNSVVGTPDYVAPETIRHPDQIFPVSDIYSLGCSLYYAVTGKVPFPGGSTSEKITRHLSDTPLHPHNFNPALPKEVCDLIAAMMDKDTKQRTPTAEKVIQELAPWCSENIVADLEVVMRNTGKTSGDSQASPGEFSGLADTATVEVDDLLDQATESPSQVSQPTDPISGSGEETAPQEKPASEVIPKPPKRKWWQWF